MDWNHFANPLLAENPRIKKWVKELLASKAEIGKAIGAPLGTMLGCGHWGCVLDSSGPWVVKLTIDPNEIPIWEKIIELVDEEGYGGAGVVRVKGLFNLEPGIPYGGRMRKVYAVVREEVEPVFGSTQRGSPSYLLSQRSKKELGFHEGVAVEYRPGYGQELGSLRSYPEGVVAHETDAVREFLTTMRGLFYYQDAARQWFAGQPNPDRVERVAYSMDGFIGHALSETLIMLISNNIVLRDVHLFNVGWRVRSTIDGEEMPKTICIFDPGHTPVGKARNVGAVRYR
jgi:hypothetical protein